MQHVIDLVLDELEAQTECYERKQSMHTDTNRRYEEMCAKHARELKPLTDALAREASELARLRKVKADCEAALSVLRGQP